ncbi:MAG: acetoacetate decarboxylase family protein [Deltaproteobacteria bacterium]|nr:acetoacetate decarboxylase family protein [Deltaproteobacteria bacterium]MBW2050609.1 acetoacetate decarboxylase family protein [Deltaproteobacteria bacterium]MBW2139497.1 acetoacetate decarboxylase family protein [Deltaproteobacteria bacterium]MBW2322554.1 acetoacetate decarboxylase family protein [Deltaproteobacteria bacterium]
MFKFEKDRFYQMPFHFGPRGGGRGTGQYHDTTTMVVAYLTDRDKLAQYLPPPFEVGEEPIVSVSYSMNREIDWLAGHSYNIIGVNASVVFNGEKDHLAGTYALVLWENLTDPILTGREIEGIPKIYADIPDHSIIDGEWRATASHFGHKIVDLMIQDLKPLNQEQIDEMGKAAENRHWMGWKYIPKIGTLGEASVSHATLFPTGGNTREAWVGKGEVKWQNLTWEQNPTQFHIVNALADLPIIEYRMAMVLKGESDLAVATKPKRIIR